MGTDAACEAAEWLHQPLQFESAALRAVTRTYYKSTLDRVSRQGDDKSSQAVLSVPTGKTPVAPE